MNIEDKKLCNELEELSFKYERMTALLDCIHALLDEGGIQISGLPEHALSYSLYEICMEMRCSNRKLSSLHAKAVTESRHRV